MSVDSMKIFFSSTVDQNGDIMVEHDFFAKRFHMTNKRCDQTFNVLRLQDIPSCGLFLAAQRIFSHWNVVFYQNHGSLSFW